MEEDQIITLIRSDRTRLRGYELLVDTYQERLYWHIRGILGNHDDTNDVLQNTLIKVWKGLTSFRGESRLYTWLYRIASNEAFTFLQREKRKPGTVTEEKLIYQKLDSDPYFDGNEAMIRLWQAIDKLPEKQKEVFRLKYFEEMKYQDMSELLSTSVGALKASYHHAVQKIKEFLQED